jgi:hypothetical protein
MLFPALRWLLMDATFKVARELEISRSAVVPVEVKPITGRSEVRCRRR